MASSRGNPDIGDILRSVAVIGVIILGLWGFGKIFTSTPEQAVSPVDYRQTLTEAQTATDVPLLAPATLPKGWRATSARFDPSDSGGSWHLGVLDADDDYLGVEQTPLSTERAVDRWADDSEPAGSADVAGEVWSVHAGPGDRIAYVRRDDGRTTLVNGTVDQAELERYIESLEPAAG